MVTGVLPALAFGGIVVVLGGPIVLLARAVLKAADCDDADDADVYCALCDGTDLQCDHEGVWICMGCGATPHR